MNKKDGKSKIENKINIDENKTKFNFIQQILKNNIGTLIDNFLSTNMNDKITKYNADSFARWAIIALKQSEEDIIKEIEKNIKI